MRTNFLLTLSYFIVFVFISGSGNAVESLPHPFKILPQPQSIVLLKGSGLEFEKLESVILKGEFKCPEMGEVLSLLTIGKSAENGTLTLVLDTAFISVPTEEGYIMTVSGNKVEIISKGEAGLFYGCQTLEQLLEDARDYKKPVPACRITDYPALSYRAVHFDVKHHLDHMNYYYESIDRLARYKVNAVVFEFEDKLRYQRQPLVGAPQAISIDEMAALTRYARERHIEITPLVQGLGHATFILKHQDYANLREIPWNRWAFCPLHEGTYQVLFDLYRDAIDATPGSKYLHIGGDEVWKIGLCPRCKPTCDKQGRAALNLYWLKRVCEFVEENNRIPIFWDDMPFQTAGLLESTDDENMPSAEVAEKWEKGLPMLDSLLADFPKNCIYMRWNYSMARQDGNILALDWYNRHGLKAMAATATNAGGGPFFEPDDRDKGMASKGIITIQSFNQLAAEKKMTGMLCTAWDDESPIMEKYWRGFIASAEYGWSPNGRTLSEFDAAWLQKEFGITMPYYENLQKQLSKGSDLWNEAYYKTDGRSGDANALVAVSRLEHWLPPVDGMEKRQIDPTKILIELPNRDSIGTWSLKYKDRLDQSQVEVDNYPAISQKLTKLYNTSIHNRYYWEVAIAMYNLQITAPRLLLALKQCDNPNVHEHKIGIAKVKKEMDGFRLAWSNLQDVYSKIRFISYPSNYVPDRYFHSASKREDLSWMILTEENYHAMIEKWLKNEN